MAQIVWENKYDKIGQSYSENKTNSHSHTVYKKYLIKIS